MSASLTALLDAVSADVVVPGAQVEPRYLSDWLVSIASGAPLALARPRTTDDVAAILRVCHAHGLSVVPQGGRTGLVGGATPIDGCVILSLERMTGVEEVDEAAATLTARAGTSLQTVQEAATAAGLFFPLDLGARGTCQIGGAVATNAGGNRVIRYGMARDLVLGLEVVLADGTVVSSLNKLIKNNAGLDVRQIFVGSEGTLGVITRVVLRLHPQPRSQCTAFCAVKDFDHIVALLKHARAALGGALSAFEMMWRDFYDVVTRPETGVTPPLPPGAGAYALVEALGADQASDQARFEQMLASAADTGIVSDAAIAQSPADARAFWRVRDSSGELPRLHGGSDESYDLGIPTSDIGRFIDTLTTQAHARWRGVQTAFFGHVGDSNLHLHIKVRDGSQPTKEINDFVYGLTRDFRGTTSAEHGIGLRKKPYLAYSRTPAEIAVMRALKQALDPKGVLNPGKIFN